MCAPVIVGHAAPPCAHKIRRALPPSTTLSTPKLLYPTVRFEYRTRRTRSNIRLPTRTTKSSNTMAPYVCDQCTDTFHNVRLYGLHLCLVHGNARAHHCPHCRSPFPHAKLLNVHIKQDHSEQKQFGCDECKCSFHSQVTRDSHVREAHRKIVIRCIDCEYETVYDGLMAKHVEDVHEKKWIPEDTSEDDCDKMKVGYLNVNGRV